MARTIVVTGASGNLGTGLLRALRHVPDLSVRAVCRRPPPPVEPYDEARWYAIDLADGSAADELARVCRGADAVVHLAWAVQPVRAEPVIRRTNVGGTAAVLDAVDAAGVPHLVVASSLGAYGSADGPVDERGPVTGQHRSAYSRHKLLIEAMVERFARERPGVVVTCVRPTLVVQREAADQVARLFLGPLAVAPVLQAVRAGLVPFLPVPARTVLQFVHADDVGRALVAILDRRPAGAFNLAADPVDACGLAAELGAHAVSVPRSLCRAVVGLLYGLHLTPLSVGWFDVAVRTPLMDVTRALDELDWSAATTTADALRILIDGLADGVHGNSAAISG